MLFRKADGTLIEINRNECKNDDIYHKKIYYAKSSNLKINEENTSPTYTRKLIIFFLEDAFNNSDNQDKYEE